MTWRSLYSIPTLVLTSSGTAGCHSLITKLDSQPCGTPLSHHLDSTFTIYGDSVVSIEIMQVPDRPSVEEVTDPAGMLLQDSCSFVVRHLREC